ncbi:hypothetical protein N2152v2_005178 [Parachlorella kessleri]
MKTFALVLIAALLGLASCDDWEKPEWCRDHDCPKFKVVNSADGYETRTYEPATWAYVKMKGVRHPDEAVMEGFAHLFKYINGDNEAGDNIPMTVPVAHNMSLHHRRRHGANHQAHRMMAPTAGLPLDVDPLMSFETSPAERAEEAAKGVISWLKGLVERGRGRRREREIDITVKFFLPYAYQEGGDKEAPKPKSDEVKVQEFPEWTAHVRSFDGFPSAHSFMENYRELVDALEDDDQDYSNDWAVFSIYNGPTELENRHNEVLLPAFDKDSKHQKTVA